MEIEGPLSGSASRCAPILRALPGWFGIESAVQHYLDEIDELPTFLALSEGQVAGFLALKVHTDYAGEIYVMGVRPEAHRRGTGRALVEAAEAWLREQDVEYLQVKTLGPSHPDPGYAKTRAFYAQMGFRPLEEFLTLWDEHNPCLLMIKRL